ncbi:hypothetical protein [Rhizobium sp. GCM10022189]|uniref:hypothetical protein n=1 Tax=Rhizobium sp. GCM10022189 TaxID=3252654 RepID=UPI00360A839B
MIADFTKEQRARIIAGDPVIAARRLQDLLRKDNPLGDTPSIEECEEIVDLVVAAVGKTGTSSNA